MVRRPGRKPGRFVFRGALNTVIAGLGPAIHDDCSRKSHVIMDAPVKPAHDAIGMAQIIIRPATPADCTRIAEIYAPAVTHGTTSFEIVAPDASEMTRRMRALTDAGFPYLAAARDGIVVGYAYAGPYRTRPAYRFTVENSIYVAPGTQRAGVGRALLEALIENCTARGHRQMLAVIGDSINQPGSIGLHKACGFVEVGRLPEVGFKFGRWLDSLLLQRGLGS